GQRVALAVVAREIVVEGRQLLLAQLPDLHLEVDGLPGEPHVGILGRIGDAQPEPRAAALAQQLALESEREAARARFEQNALPPRPPPPAPGGRAPPPPAPRLDLRPVLHRAQLGDRLPELAEGALDVLVAHARRGPHDLEAAQIAERDRGAYLHRGRVAQRR